MRKSFDYINIINKTKKAYENQFLNYGSTPKGVFWQNNDTQEARFKTLIGAISKNDLIGGVSISDFGCGYGALYNFIKDKPFMKNSMYIGYDIVPSLIEEASKRLPEAKFICSQNILHPSDYIFVSGTFNMSFDKTIKTWKKYIENQLLHCFSMTKKVLAFNLLCSQTSKIENNLFYTNIEEIEIFCKNYLGSCLVIKTPVAKNDITIFVTRD